MYNQKANLKVATFFAGGDVVPVARTRFPKGDTRSPAVPSDWKSSVSSSMIMSVARKSISCTQRTCMLVCERVETKYTLARTHT